ncbi:MAG: hypothetical protein K2P87_15240 [Lachnospiraceae bacterium]|nr:hypothetical protein [Lachnospiraceae bacterium]
MPFISSRVSVPVSGEQKDSLAKELGKMIALIPGKSEEWLMLEFAGGCEMYFAGDRSQPCAMIEIKVFGKIPADSSAQMTKAVCGLYEKELHIKKERIYIKYEEVSQWGWNAVNF